MLSRMKQLPEWPVGKPSRIVFIVTACVAIIIVPLLIILGYFLYHSHELRSTQRVGARMFEARLAAATVATQFDGIREFGSWYSQSAEIRTLVSDRNWNALSENMDRVVEHLPAVVRLFASDNEGRLWADSPRKPEVHGTDFSFRDWFKGAMDRQAVYLSHAYRRTAEPRIQVASMAFPIHDSNDETTGVVVFQLSLDNILSWAGNALLESSARLVFIDHDEQRFEIDEDTGKVVLRNKSADYIDTPLAATVTEDPAIVVRNDDQTVTGYAGGPGWNWGVHISESAETFFAGRNRERQTMLLATGLMLALCLVAAATAFALLRTLARKERELANTNTGLLSANRNLREFTYAVSHDLRAPLRAMNGFAEALVEDQGEKLDDEGRQYLERIRAGSHKLGRMIEDLLAVARIQQTELRLQEVDLSRLAQDIANEFQAMESGRTVNVRIQPNAIVQGDSTLLTLVLRNLFQNAWKFTRGCPQAEIEFGCEQAPGERIYFIRDNGAGFDQEYVHKLFAMFQRLHTEAEFEGTGIGLAASLQAIELHGGRIWAEGREGEGAVFRFTVPAGETTRTNA
jgi:signal transduction histidine kinase